MNEMTRYYRSFNSETELLSRIREFLNGHADNIELPDSLSFNFDPDISQIYITLFQEGMKPLRWGAKLQTIEGTLLHAAKRLQEHLRFIWFDVGNASVCRIMFEMVTEEYPCNIRNMTILRMSPNRFEAGVTGLKCIYKNNIRYFMPTDAIAHSVMSVKQVLNVLSKKTGVSKQSQKISERVHLMRRLPIDYTFIKSVAFISFEEKALPLYRGYPMPVQLSKKRVEATMLNSMDWLVNNMHKEGSFLYYYDGIKDSEIDFNHPNMTDPLYYNILRHSGGTITLLLGYEHSGKEAYLDAAKRSINYFIKRLHDHDSNGSYACYPFYNKKSKLGGAGIGLVSLMHYFRLTDDTYYHKQIDGLVRHILSRIEDDGEMIGYYIHPKYQEGKPLTKLSPEEKKALFSFYYPGEALLGLAMYYTLIGNIEPSLKDEIFEKSKKALDFLVNIRPEKYADLFDALPSDAWLMQAIETWSYVEGVVSQEHLDFVFNDATTMIEHMYTLQNAPSFDYIGGFFYNYGDHVYHDASRCEGLIAAYRLAKKCQKIRLSENIMNHMLLSAKGLLYTYHSAESTYAHKYPKRSIGSFRFKLTRQWVRVDSVQHTACFYAGLIRLL